MTKKMTLGRGLEGLMTSVKKEEKSAPDILSSGQPLMVSIASLEANPDQPRRDFNENDLKFLAKSIKLKGIIEPLVVKELGTDKYQIIAGERRFRAAKLAELNEVPVIIKKIDTDADRLELALVENLCREDLNPIEEAESFSRLEEEFKRTHQEIAELAGRDRVTVTNSMRLLKLPDYLKDDIRYKRLSAGHGRAILGLTNKELLNQIRSEVIAKSLTVRQTEALVRKLNKKPASKKNHDFGEEAYFENLSQAFTARLGGLKVKIDHFSKTKKMEIFYNNNDELEMLMNKFGVKPS